MRIAPALRLSYVTGLTALCKAFDGGSDANRHTSPVRAGKPFDAMGGCGLIECLPPRCGFLEVAATRGASPSSKPA